MRIPTLRRDAGVALARANEDLAAVDAQIASLQQERLDQLLDAEPGEIEAIDFKISDLHRQAKVYAARVAGFEQRLAAERQELDKKAYQAAVEGLKGPMAERNQALAKVARLLDELGAAACEFERKDRAVFGAWPPDVPWPVRVYLPGYLGTAWVGERVGDVLGPDLVDHHTRRRPAASEWFRRLCTLHGTSVAETGADQGRAVLEDMRTAHDEPSVEDETTEEEAA